MLELELSSIPDDATRPERITLAIAGGTTDAEAQSSSTPLLVALEGSRRFVRDDTIPVHTHLAAAAVDLAGNAGARSASVEYVREE